MAMKRARKKQNRASCIETICRGELTDSNNKVYDSNFEDYYLDKGTDQLIINIQCWDKNNECYTIQDYDSCRKSSSGRESCAVDSSSLPPGMNNIEEFATCKPNSSSPCYTVQEWRISPLTMICSPENSENVNQCDKNAWGKFVCFWKGSPEVAIPLVIGAILILVGLFIAGYYFIKPKPTQPENIQADERLL